MIKFRKNDFVMAHNYRQILSKFWLFRYLVESIYFNFHYLPFRQAIKIPIVLYKPEFQLLKGRILIDSKNISFAMIKLGHREVSLYKNNGFQIKNRGTIIFYGKCNLGSGTCISVGEDGTLEFGEGMHATAEMKIACYKHISFGVNSLVGWECSFIDSDFHRLTTTDESQAPEPLAPITIGDHCWIANSCSITKGTTIPSKCVVASHSLCNKVYSVPECTLLAGVPAKPIRHNIWLDRNNWKI